MKRSIIYLTAVVLAVAGCSVEIENSPQEIIESQPEMELVTIYASLNDETKTTVDGTGVFSWQTSEIISVVAQDGTTGLDFTLTDSSTGAFTGSKPAGKDLVLAVSPKAALTSAVEDAGDILYDITLPTTYSDYVPGTTNAIMIGAPDGGSYKFKFYNTAAILKFTYVNVPIGTKKCVLSTPEKIAGTWSNLDSINGIILDQATIASTGSSTVTLILKETVSKANQTLEFCFPVPVGNYTGFDIELQDSDGTRVEGTNKSKGSISMDLVAGNVVLMPTINLDAAVITKGKEYTFEFGGTKKFDSWGSAVTQNSMIWTLDKVTAEASANPGNWDGSDRGQQLGTGGDGSKLTVVSLKAVDYAAYCGSSTAVGINEIHLIAGAKNKTTITCTVSVGGVAMSAKASGSDSYTAASTLPGTMTFTSGSILTGDIEITYTLDNPGALYINDITINPDLRTPVTLSFANSSIAKTTDDYGTFTGQGVTASPDVDDITDNITYSKTDPSSIISSFNTSTGVLALNGTTGTATITASFLGDGTYKPASKSYTITVATADDVSGTWASWPQTSAWTISTNTVNSTVDADFCKTDATFEVYNSSDTKVSLTTFGSGSFNGVYFNTTIGCYVKISLPVSKAIPVGTKITVSCYVSANSKVYDSWTVSYDDSAVGAAVSVNHNGSPSSLSDMTQISRTYTTTSAIAKDSVIEFKITAAAGTGSKTGNSRITNIVVSAE